MFETTILSTGPKSKRAWTTIVGGTGQALLVAGLVLAPLISPAALPRVIWGVSLAPPPAPLPPPVPVQVQPAAHIRIVRANAVFTEPSFVPPQIKMVVDDVADAAPVGAYVPGAVATTGATTGSPDG